MIIHSLSVSGFKIIGESIDINFPEEGRIGIFGPNESGKSTLLESIEYALYGLKKGRSPGETREDIVTWGKEKAEFKLEFTSGENRYFVVRSVGSRSGHKATLYVLVEGNSELLESCTDGVSKEVERITGMDRDIFTKLVYIKQKDLDALKVLSKANREALINKVMGMEVFDESAKKINDDLKGLRSTKSEKDIELEAVRKNKEQYEGDLNRRNELVKEKTELESGLAGKKSAMDASQVNLSRYDWLQKKTSSEELLQEMQKSLEKDKKSLEEWNILKETIKTQTSALSKLKPKFESLEESLDKFTELETNTRRLKKELKALDKEKGDEIVKSGMPSDEIESLTPNLQRRKKFRIMCGFITLTVGLAFLVAAFIANLFLFAGCIPFLLISVFFFVSYWRLERISGLHVKIQAIMSEIENKSREFDQSVKEIESLRQKDGHQSSEEVVREKEALLSKLSEETGTKSVEGLDELVKSNKNRERALAAQGLDKRIAETNSSITLKATELSALEKARPLEVDGIKYSEKAHQKARETFTETQTEYNGLKESYDRKEGELKELKGEIERLKPDFDRFPILENDVNELKIRIVLRERVVTEIKETGRELRSKVLPHAGFIINSILPTITDGRYSDLAITEDLKFNVHSMEAGGYKEREVFSGGTQDQFLIALRLAFTESILDSRVKADYYSMLMDECISSSDEARKQGIFEVLELMKKTFRQLFIVAHEDISAFVDHHLVLTRDDKGYTQVKSKSW